MPKKKITPSKENLKAIADGTKWLKDHFKCGTGANVQVWVDTDDGTLHAEDHVSGNTWIRHDDDCDVDLGFFTLPVSQKRLKLLADKAIAERKAQQEYER